MRWARARPEGSKQRIMQSRCYVRIFAYRYGYVETGYAEW